MSKKPKYEHCTWEEYEQDRRTAAIHEAAHAVIGHVLGLHITCAGINLSDEAGTIAAQTHTHRLDSSLRSKLADVMCCFAGALAERLLLRHSAARANWGGKGDWDAITHILDELSLDLATRFMVEHRLRERVKELIWEYEKSIRHVATSLLTYNHIGVRPGEDITRVTRPAAGVYLHRVIIRENPDASLSKNVAEYF